MHSKQKHSEAYRTNSVAQPDGSGPFPRKERTSEAHSLAASRYERDIEIRVQSYWYPNAPIFEIWTERTVYEFDVNLCCIAARDLNTDEDTRPQCLGARLLGGRRLQNHVVDMSTPLPGVGYSAMLKSDDEIIIVTSPVTRVIMYVRRWSSPPIEFGDATTEVM